MNREEYKKEIEAIQAQRSALENKEHELRQQYINSNKEFEVGDRVEIHFAEVKDYLGRNVVKPERIEFGYVQAIYINSYKDVAYRLVKEKKDGTPSTRELSLWLKIAGKDYTIKKAANQ